MSRISPAAPGPVRLQVSRAPCSVWTMYSGRPLAGTRRLQRRPSASQISCTKMDSLDARSRRRLNR
ncbi:hypothetical protein BGY98DRAFT_1014744 [Russula aff. rugulosa BPL654]|nr:hypothetical protein BGY98DRAFT_1014744 [Russula aff. rugulosa BPL654]